MAISYEDAKSIAHDGDAGAREALAGQGDIPPELLYYLAEDETPAVRRAVAGNTAAPIHADLLLARDADEIVRAVLAGKLSTLAASNALDRARLRDIANEALMLLAKDQATRIRQILSDALHEIAHAPADVIRRLAWDVETAVAAPILRDSPVLSDADLIEIIVAKPSPGAISAVSERQGVSGDVSDAIVDSADIDAIALLLGNSSAQIREETLDRVIAAADKIDLWHMPLAMRPKLPSKAAVKIAQVVTEDILKRMQARNDLSAEATTAIRDVVLQRLGDGIALMPEEGAAQKGSVGMHPDDDNIFDRAASEWAAGTLNEKALLHELTVGDINFAKAIIAVMADVPFRLVDKVLAQHSPKGWVALSWRAGLTPKAAEIVQKKLGGIKPAEIMLADGQNFPMSESDMIWQIERLIATKDSASRG